MPLNKEDLSFKTLINKEFSTPSRLFFQENTVSTLDTNDTEVYSDTIPATTASAVSAGVGRVLTSFSLTPDPSFPTSVWYVISGSGFTPGVSTLPSFATSASFYQRNFISDKYGSAYTVILTDNLGNQIFPTDAINWIFQYKTGILAIADPGNGSYSTPYKVTVVQYAGRTLADNRTRGYTGSFTGSFTGDGSGLTNLSASAIVGLNLSQIASGSFTASISPALGFRVNTSASITGSLFVSASFSTSSAAATLYKSGSTVLDVQGSQGQLFSVVDSLTGSLMSVNDISGLPILEVFSDDKVVMGTYGAPAIVVSGSNTTFSGSVNISGSLTSTGSVNISGSITATGAIISNGINVVDNAIAMAIALG